MKSIVLLTATLIVATPIVARAEEDCSKAREQSVELSKQGKYGEVLQILRKAQAACPNDPEIAFGIGLTLKTMGNIIDAVAEFRQILNNRDPVFRAHAAELLKDLESTGYFVMNCQAPGTEVFVDGKSYGKTPLGPVELPRGTHQVKTVPDKQGATRAFPITLNGADIAYGHCGAYLAITSNVKGASVELDRNELGTTPLPGPIEVNPGPHQVAIKSKGYVSQELNVDTPAGQTVPLALDLQPRFWNATHITGLAFVGAAAVSGLITAIVATNANSAFDTAQANGCPDSPRDGTDCSERADAVQSLNDTTKVLAGVAVGLGLVGGGLLLVPTMQESATERRVGLSARMSFY